MQAQGTPPPPPPSNNNPSVVTKILDQLQQAVENSVATISARTVALERDFTAFNATFAAELGQTQQAIIGLREEIAIATPGVVGLGGDLQDVFNIQKSIAQELNTNLILLGETTTDLFAAATAVGVSSEKVGEMVGAFQDAGIQAGLVRDRIQETVDIARSVGVNTSAVFSLVEKNLDELNKYGFEDGVAGLSRMAAQAAMMRTDMSKTFVFAERIFSPEGAINAVAAFQRLGVAVGDLADPFRLMYLASEDVEELQNQVVKMTQSMTYFDEETKEFKVFPNAKRDLREIANETGLAQEDLIQMSVAQQKLNMIAKDFRISGIDEESQQFIANLATYSKDRDGFVVKIGKDEKLITELTQDDIDQLQNQPVTLEELALAQLTEDELQTALLQKLVDSFAAPTAASRLATDPREISRGILMGANETLTRSFGNQRAGIESVNRALESNSEALLKLLSGEGSFAELSQTVLKTTTSIEEGFGRVFQGLVDTDYSEIIKKYTSSGNIIYEAAEKAYKGITTLYKKVSDYTVETVTPAVDKLTASNSKTLVEFTDLKYTGNLNVTLTTPTGTEQNFAVTDKMAFDLFQNPTFQKYNQMAIQSALSQNNYSALPNTA